MDWIDVEMLPKLLEYWRDGVVVQLYRLIHFVGGGGSFCLARDRHFLYGGYPISFVIVSLVLPQEPGS